MTQSTHSTALFWLRRDLRLTDNPALAYAMEHAERIVPVYIHAPDEEGRWAPGGATQWWLHRSLKHLSAALKERGSKLVIRSGGSLEELQKLIEETGASMVVWNRLYEPTLIERDKKIKATLREQGVDTQSHNGALLFEPWTIKTGAGTPYRVFTPFWRRAQQDLANIPSPLPAPKKIHSPSRPPKSETVDSLGLNPTIPWDDGLEEAWEPGEDGAAVELEKFIDSRLVRYPEGRNRPDEPGTSRLSPHLHFGEISPRQVLAALSPDLHDGTAEAKTAAAGYIRQIGWREFAHHLLFHYPHTSDKPLDERFNDYPWIRDKAGLKAWQRGRTGYPLVDAGLRELWTTGWMHNRVRMSVASFLTKNLRIHWLEGARWFWDTLVDADLANNTMGWQWTAGCGADASPYYRIFNPVLQAEKFDPNREYIRRWIPELSALPDRWLHRPWEAPEDVLKKAGVQLGRTYPKPIVELRASRDAALNGYKDLKRA